VRQSTIIALTLLLAVVPAHGEERSDISITGDARLLSVSVTDAPLVDVAETMARQLALEITVPQTTDISISADISGSLEQVLTALLPRQNYLIEYSGGQPVRLAVFDLDTSGLSGGPTVTLSPPIRSFNNRIADAPQGVGATRELPAKAVRRVGGITDTTQTGVAPDRPRPPGESDPVAPPELSPAQEAALSEAAAQLQQQSSDAVNALVRDLQAICPPGHEC